MASPLSCILGKSAFTTTSPNCCVSDVSCITPKLAGWMGLYTVLYPIEEIRTS
ncbi:hypothetical protein [Phocaeicola plebeius]|uniref:hypothetical protein n=1 Tax=Phocaeicola plebeius TaxID=310297 RepID=UPI002174E1D9|nr:hypothetical protein [Phocaeicola plebeius]